MNYNHDLISVGKVSTVNVQEKTARVAFFDSDSVSGELLILASPKEWLPAVGEMVLCIFIPRGEGDGFIVGRF